MSVCFITSKVVSRDIGTGGTMCVPKHCSSKDLQGTLWAGGSNNNPTAYYCLQLIHAMPCHAISVCVAMPPNLARRIFFFPTTMFQVVDFLFPKAFNGTHRPVSSMKSEISEYFWRVAVIHVSFQIALPCHAKQLLSANIIKSPAGT